jgi:glyoxylase-like metal-dependent hydrolase (beta-lactamase superfamily II)
MDTVPALHAAGLTPGGLTPGGVAQVVLTHAHYDHIGGLPAHYFEELERDRPFSIVASLADMYAAFDQIRELANGGARVVAGHDPLVAERFGHPADAPDVITISR